MLSQSKLPARSPLPLYLSSFEIMLNVMLDLFESHCLSETEETSKADESSPSQAVGSSCSGSRKQLTSVRAAFHAAFCPDAVVFSSSESFISSCVVTLICWGGIAPLPVAAFDELYFVLFFG